MANKNTIISKGTKNIKYYVKDYENSLIIFNSNSNLSRR